MKNLKLIVKYLFVPVVKTAALDGVALGLGLLAALLVYRHVQIGSSQEGRALLAAAGACAVNNAAWIGFNAWRVLRQPEASSAA